MLAKSTMPFHDYLETTHGLSSISLYLRSETLWFLPPIEICLSPTRNLKLPYYLTLASDGAICRPEQRGQGTGCFKPNYPAPVLKVQVLLEAYLRLSRDPKQMQGGFSISMVCYMYEYIKSDSSK